MDTTHPWLANIALCLLLACLLWLVRRHAISTGSIAPAHIVRRPASLPDTPVRLPRNARKPPWVIEEVLRLRALSGRGCLKIAEMFNRRHADDGVSVGKTFVAETIKKQAYQLLMLKRQIRNAKPRAVANNLIWGIDLTEVRLDKATTVPVLGMIDHGSRACLGLQRHVQGRAWASRHSAYPNLATGAQ